MTFRRNRKWAKGHYAVVGANRRTVGYVSKDPLNETWANSKSVRVFKTRLAAAENLL